MTPIPTPEERAEALRTAHEKVRDTHATYALAASKARAARTAMEELEAEARTLEAAARTAEKRWTTAKTNLRNL